jgi:hypothetical protein
MKTTNTRAMEGPCGQRKKDAAAGPFFYAQNRNWEFREAFLNIRYYWDDSSELESNKGGNQKYSVRDFKIVIYITVNKSVRVFCKKERRRQCDIFLTGTSI